MKQQKRKVLQVVRLKVRLKSVGGWMMMKRFLINNQKVPPSSYSEFQLFSFLFPGKLIQGQTQHSNIERKFLNIREELQLYCFFIAFIVLSS